MEHIYYHIIESAFWQVLVVEFSWSTFIRVPLRWGLRWAILMIKKKFDGFHNTSNWNWVDLKKLFPYLIFWPLWMPNLKNKLLIELFVHQYFLGIIILKRNKKPRKLTITFVHRFWFSAIDLENMAGRILNFFAFGMQPFDLECCWYEYWPQALLAVQGIAL